MDLSGIDISELWLRYLAIGGNGTEAELSFHVRSEECADDHEHNLIAQAINEAFLDRGDDHPVGYRHTGRSAS
jgi:hypothetical protein